jgi:hypothetical protein
VPAQLDPVEQNHRSPPVRHRPFITFPADRGSAARVLGVSWRPTGRTPRATL